MKKALLILIFFSTGTLFSQVGINTTNPSPVAVLDVNSSANGTNFGGFMLPRVTLEQRDLIPVTEDDAGLIIFVRDGAINELQLWNGDGWVSAFPKTLEHNALIAAWEVNGLTNFGPSPFDETSSNIGVIVGGLTRGSGVGTSGSPIAANAWGASEWSSGFPNSSDETKQTAIDNSKFITFSITPNIGVTLSITSIEPYNIRRSGTGPPTGIWQYSINGGSFIDIGSEITWGTNTTGTGNSQSAIDLSGISDLQNLSSGTTVTFRIVNWGTNSGVGTWYINNKDGNDLVVKGTILQ